MDAVWLLQTASALLLNASFCWLAGTWLARHWLAQAGAAGYDAAGYGAALRRGDLPAAALAAAGGMAGLLAATAVMGGVGLGEAFPMLPMMLAQTAYGRAGSAALLAMALLFALRLWQGGPAGLAGAVQPAALLALAVFTVTRASMGHAGENGFWTVPLAAEALHLGAVGVWTGAVLVSGWLVLRAPRVQGLAGPAIDSYLERMSQAAMVAVAVIAATGVYNGWHRVGSTEHLLHTEYGWTLLAKVALVLAAIGLGGYNKYVGLPAAARSARGMAVVRAVLQLESILLLGALAAAAVLTSQQPPTA